MMSPRRKTGCCARMLLAGLCFASVCAAHSAYALPLSSGLLGYWQFDGTSADSSGNGNTLALNGGASYGTGLFGQALALNGLQGSNAQQPVNNPAFDLNTGNFSIQVWANLASVFNVNGQPGVLIEKFSNQSGPGWTFYSAGSSIQFYANGTLIASGGVTVPTGQWNDYLMVRNGSVFDMYYDGSLLATGSYAGSVGGSSNPLLIGARDLADGRNFTLRGRIDETAIWNRALSASDIAALWNNGAGRPLTDIPEPTTLALLGFGLLAARVAARRH